MFCNKSSFFSFKSEIWLCRVQFVLNYWHLYRKDETVIQKNRLVMIVILAFLISDHQQKRVTFIEPNFNCYNFSFLNENCAEWSCESISLSVNKLTITFHQSIDDVYRLADLIIGEGTPEATTNDGLWL